jgi:hypothetical protein
MLERNGRGYRTRQFDLFSNQRLEIGLESMIMK